MAGTIPTFTVDQRAFTLLGENLYEGRLAAIWAREVLQNALDAGAKNVTITFRRAMFPEGQANFDFRNPCQYDWQGREAVAVLSCEDDGIGMDEDVLLNAFLKLGGSFKMEEDTVGGYGVAKAIILCGQRWSVDTNDCHLDHTMMGVEPVRKVEAREGTRIEMAISTPNYSRWQFEDLRNCLALSHVPGVKVRLVQFAADGRTLSDEIIRGIRPGKEIDDLGWAVLSTNSARSDTYRGLHVRARGLYQFTDYLSHDTCAFLDIPHLPRAGDVAYPLTVSRETLKTERKQQVQAVINRLVVEPSQARRRDVEEETVTQFAGRRKRWESLVEPVAVPYVEQAALVEPNTDLRDVLPKLEDWEPGGGGLQYEPDPSGLEMSPLGFPFLVLKHRKLRHLTTERTQRGMKLLNVWHSLVSEVVDILGSTYTLDDEVCVGFVMRENTAAMYYREDEVRAILVNPRGVRVSDPVKTLMPRLLYRLIEELLHSGGLSVHDETLHYETFGAFDRLMRDHHKRLEAAVRRGLAATVPDSFD